MRTRLADVLLERKLRAHHGVDSLFDFPLHAVGDANVESSVLVADDTKTKILECRSEAMELFYDQRCGLSPLRRRTETRLAWRQGETCR